MKAEGLPRPFQKPGFRVRGGDDGPGSKLCHINQAVAQAWPCAQSAALTLLSHQWSGQRQGLVLELTGKEVPGPPNLPHTWEGPIQTERWQAGSPLREAAHR
jgi:hypothetical protein